MEVIRKSVLYFMWYIHTLLQILSVEAVSSNPCIYSHVIYLSLGSLGLI